MATNRRLAAIMFTDMVGYTALSQNDESSALKLLDRHNQLLRPFFPRFHGREVKTVGDSFLIEFESALDATSCAFEIQRFLHELNLSALPESKIQIRIGIHLGDVVHTADDVFGDSVNIASRIEPLAEPGGICITEPVFGQIRNKIPNKLEKLEPTALKNIRFPVDIYRVVLPWTVREPPSAAFGPTRLAVLPFANISPDPKDEYFADGLTEELITVLSHLRELRVIARTSVSQYKSTSKSVSQIGAELGVDAILEGSVRKAGDDLRITVQLIDVETEEHTWANTYDRKLEKVFAVQAKIAKQVAEALKIELRAAEEARLEGRPSVRPDSYLAYLKGQTLLHSTSSRTELEAAKNQFELAISLDAHNAAAHSGLADATRIMGWRYPDVPRAKWDEVSRRLAKRAIELDPNLAEAHASLALALWDDFDYAAAEKEVKHALSLNPSGALAHRMYADLLLDEARADEALLESTLAEAADPHWPLNLVNFALLLIWLGRLDEALVKIQKYTELEPSSPVYHSLLARYCLARSDRERCLKEIQQVQELLPDPREKEGARALYYALSGEKEQARALLRHDETLPDRPQRAQSIASIYAELGDLDECFRWLEKAIETHYIAFQRWRLDPRLEHVRADSRFQLVLKKMNLA